ncbi:HlyD family type I secretion periplasmic adaptor subunit [Aquabacterium sp.]|uniref:HlyD family type I secretion periplasmic adaptor subunit n=1 Tax=Aquabacterium sp. TaxID=1872578 RepID=UPI002BB331E3|nr:HlyD family type I secretion periplasmic adaptor subunit [Aquabacterium sp.]HSW05889.1 HlyD family type I secretion periplasmic adaptor subunit [Aquabacterium sp.]
MSTHSSSARPALTAVPSGAAASDVTDVDDSELKTDTKPVIRLGFWILVVGFGLFLLWAAFAPLDEGVAAPATVSIETRRKIIQHMQGGVVQKVLVKEGATVKQGDVLIVLDDATTRATYEAIRQNYLSQRALESRLLSEVAGAPAVTFHADLLANKTDPLAIQHMTVQQQLFNSRRAAQRAEISAARQSITGLEAQIAGLKQMVESRGTQAALQSRQLANVKSLAEEGFAPRNQALQLEQAQAELRSTMADLQTTVQRTQNSILETQLRIAQREQEFLKEVSTQLADVRREVQANQERLVAITNELGRMQIRSPVAGQVIGLGVAGPGAVVAPGQRLLDVVPQGESLLLDAKVPPNVIDRVKVGDNTEVRFTAFANTPQLVVHGKIVSLAGDAITEQVGNLTTTYYLARVEITPEGNKALGSRTLQPGMTAEVLIKTGERSLLTYMLHPLIKRIAAAMTEE